MARILVVDDELANRELMAYLLRHFGHEVTTAPDGAGALRTALAEHPDLVVMDVAMPGMDGYTAARLMRAEQALSDVRLVAVSATGVASLAAARAAGFDAFYPMPIEPGELMALLEPFIRAPAVDGTGEGEPR
jgi:CheY-like chemotaxis protein